MLRTGRHLFCAAALLQAIPSFAQQVATHISYPSVTALPRGQVVIDIATLTRHPAYLEPQSLKVPDGVRILASVAAPDNIRTCARGASSGSECRQVFRVTLDTLPRCHAGGDYEAMFRIACWPGTAASLCKPGGHQRDFKLVADPLCADDGRKG